MGSLIRSNVLAYGRRYFAVIAAVAIGVAFLTATLLVSSTVRATLGQSVGQDYSEADLVLGVTSDEYDEDEAADADLLKQVQGVDGVASATATASDYIELSTRGQSTYSQAVVADGDPDLLGQKLTEGVAPGEHGIALSHSAAKQLDVKVGDAITASGFDPETEKETDSDLKVTGVREDSQSPLAAGSPMVQLDAATAKSLDLRTSPSQVLVSTQPGKNASVTSGLEQIIKAQGLHDASVMTPEEKTNETVKSFTGDADVLTWILGLFAAIALVVTVLVVSNTFSVILTQRTRELALLRTLGARRSQIKRMVTGESVVMGLLGSVIGVLLATVVLWGGCSILASTADLPYLTFGMNWTAVVVGIVVGLVITLMASLRPARAATKVAPLAALRPQETVTATSRRGTGRIVVGLVLVLIGAAGLLAGTADVLGAGASLGVAFLGGLLSFIGVLMLGTFLIPWAVRVLSKLFGAKVSGRLAGLNALRHPQRTAAIGTALLLGVTLVSMMATGATSARSTLNTELAEQYPVDLTVQQNADPDSGKKPLSQAGADAARGLDGVEQVELVEPVGVVGDCAPSTDDDEDGTGNCVTVSALDRQKMTQVLAHGATLPAEGKVAAGTFAFEGNTPSSVQIVDASGKQHEVPVDADAAGPDESGFTMTASTAKRLGLTSPTAQQAETADAAPSLWIRADDDVDANDLVEDVARVTGVDQNDIDGAMPIRQAMSQIIDALLMVVSALLAVAVVIALIGVSNTLSLSVIERTRENSLLRALGLTKKQLRWMLALEAGLIAGASAVLGIVLGAIYGTAGAKSALSSVGAFSLGIPWGWLVIVLVIAVGAAVLASLVPARRATRLSPVEGLAME